MAENTSCIMVTGGAGFIGSTLVRYLIGETRYRVVTVDKLTYAGNISSLAPVAGNARHVFEQGDIGDRPFMEALIKRYRPAAILNLAAETHVDRSIDGPAAFLRTNVMGTGALLDSIRACMGDAPAGFRFIHISTDEVYGDLEPDEPAFTESHAYRPNSPYSASKAASDHLVRAWYKTYGLPAIITNCSNNYGPYHYPEKFIPHMILNALAGKALPVYGDGHQVRDWLYVDDHVRALVAVLERGNVSETYNIGGNNEYKNLDVVRAICDVMEASAGERKPAGVQSYTDLITFVTDRPGHDRRYAIDNRKITRDLGWTPQETFETGLRKTVQWYLENETWWRDILNKGYDLKRLGRTE